MNFLLVGGGGREHAIATALKKSSVNLFAVMKNKNPGIARICNDFVLASEVDVEKVVDYAASKNIDIAVIGPEAPLEKGLADELEKKSIGVVGPKKDAALIETSKEFMRKLMTEYNIPGAVRYEVVENLDEAKDFIHSLNGNAVIKPVGLTGGKGVKVIGEHLKNATEALEYIKEIINKKIGGASKVVIEEKIDGEEFTMQAFCDGKNIIPMPLVQDFKRAFENDLGPNTGGMGSYSQETHLLPFIEKDDYEKACEILRKIVSALRQDGKDYRGILYGQFMLGKNSPKVIECNARFGDPEAMNVLPILESDFAEICESICDCTLSNAKIEFAKKATVCKYIVPRGYGIKPVADKEIFVDETKVKSEDGLIFYAAVNEKDKKIYTTTSRAVAVVGIANDIETAEGIAERALKHITGDAIYARHDIGKKYLIDKKIRRMKELRISQH